MWPSPDQTAWGGGVGGGVGVGGMGYLPVRAVTSSAAVAQRSRSSPTWAFVPRSGSRVGTRCRDSRPGMSKITESHEAAATESGYCCRQRPRKYAREYPVGCLLL